MSGLHLSANAQLVLWMVVIGAICNASCAMLGCYLVLRRLSLLGDAISHAILPGVVVGFILSGSSSGWPILLGALVFGVLTAFLTQTLHGFGNVPEDASMGVVFTALFAVGVILISALLPKAHLDVDCVLFGKIEYALLDMEPLPGLGWSVPVALWTLVPVLLMTVGFVLLLWKELKIGSFDPVLATAMGFNANLVHYLLMGMVAAVTVACLKAVGSILVVAMLIVPAATAHLLADRLTGMMLAAVVLGVLAAVGGCAGAVYWNTSGAGMMAVVAGLLFALAVFFAPRHGLLSKGWHNLALTLRIASEDVIAALYRLEEKAGAVVDGLDRKECIRAAGAGWTARLALPWLRLKGLTASSPDGRFRLTAAGREVARSLVRAHRLWEAFLVSNFELPLDHLHEPASRIEHFIGPKVQEELAAELNRPLSDPHGKPIPPGPG